MIIWRFVGHAVVVFWNHTYMDTVIMMYSDILTCILYIVVYYAVYL